MSIKNFIWHLPGQIASGSMPLLSEDLSWLASQGFKNIISLVRVSPSTAQEAKGLGIKHYFLPLSSQPVGDLYPSGPLCLNDLSPETWQKFGDLVTGALESGPVYVHCLFGAERSPTMAEHYAAKITPKKGEDENDRPDS